MRVLAIDTALGACSAVLFDTDTNRPLAIQSIEMNRGHAEALIAGQLANRSDLRLDGRGVRLIGRSERPQFLLGLFNRAIRGAFRKQRLFLGFVERALLLGRERDVLRVIKEEVRRADVIKVR